MITSKNENCKKVIELLDHPTSHMEQLVDVARRILKAKTIPVSKVSTSVSPSSNGNDPVVALFERINTGGTQISVEELVYSIYKSVWPKAHDLIEHLSSNTKIMTPASLLWLTIRVTLAQLQVESPLVASAEVPRSPNVREFRQWLDGKGQYKKDFGEKLEWYYESNRMGHLLEKALCILRFNRSDVWDPGLPPILIARLAGSSPDLFLLLLVWIDRNIGKDGEIEVDSHERRCILAALTSIRWFSKDWKGKECVRRLWKKVGNRDLWCHGMCLDLVEVKDQEPLVFPPLPPEEYARLTDQQLCGDNSLEEYTIEKLNQNSLWKFRSAIPVAATKWYARMREGDVSGQEWQKDAWMRFAWTMFHQDELLLYAQRGILVRWFPQYDPSRCDRLEDFDRPWDYDHILASHYIDHKRHIPTLIRDLHGSIGNKRVWPMALNRSDGEAIPSNKLMAKIDAYERENGMDCRQASLIGDEEWQFWKNSCPDSLNFSPGYLAERGQEYDYCRQAVVRAISVRCFFIYKSWYESLQVEKLFAKAPRRL